MSPRDCPRYDGCNAPICPLDHDWHRRGVEPGEAVCPYLRETARPDVRTRYVGRYDEPVLIAAFTLKETLDRHPHPRYASILRQIDASADSPDLIAQGERTAARLAAARAKKGACVTVDKATGMETPSAGTVEAA